MLVSPLPLFKKAKKGGYAIGAFNTSNLEITKAIIATAERLNSPVIIETSESEMNFLNPEVAVAEVRALAEEVKIPIVLHLDHGKELENIMAAIEAGYTSVHVDGSSLPFDQNLGKTKEAVGIAHAKKIAVEGEIGHVAGSSQKHELEIAIPKESLTDPEEAEKFAKFSKVDVLAVAIGNIHGVYKNPPQLNFQCFEEISSRVKTYFSLHGGSGIPKAQIEKAIKMGIVKVNVNTELRLAFQKGLMHEFEVHPEEVVPYKYLPAGREAVERVVEAKIRLFGSSGKA